MDGGALKDHSRGEVEDALRRLGSAVHDDWKRMNRLEGDQDATWSYVDVLRDALEMTADCELARIERLEDGEPPPSDREGLLVSGERFDAVKRRVRECRTLASQIASLRREIEDPYRLDLKGETLLNAERMTPEMVKARDWCVEVAETIKGLETAADFEQFDLTSAEQAMYEIEKTMPWRAPQKSVSPNPDDVKQRTGIVLIDADSRLSRHDDLAEGVSCWDDVFSFTYGGPYHFSWLVEFSGGKFHSAEVWLEKHPNGAGGWKEVPGSRGSAGIGPRVSFNLPYTVNRGDMFRLCFNHVGAELDRAVGHVWVSPVDQESG